MNKTELLLNEMRNWNSESRTRVMAWVSNENINSSIEGGYTLLGFMIGPDSETLNCDLIKQGKQPLYDKKYDDELEANVRQLLDHGADPRHYCDDGYDALWAAEENSSSRELKKILVIACCRLDELLNVDFDRPLEHLIRDLESLLLTDHKKQPYRDIEKILRYLEVLSLEPNQTALKPFIRNFNGDAELAEMRDSLHEEIVSDEGHVAAAFIGTTFSPFRQYIQPSPLHQYPETQVETYHRSTKGPIATFFKAKRIQYSQLETPDSYFKAKNQLKSTSVAHYGLYRHPLEAGNLTCQVSPKRVSFSGLPGHFLKHRGLYDAWILYKRESCDYVASRCGGLPMLEVGYYEKYPCLMVCLRNLPMVDDTQMKYFIEFVISYFLGKLNFNAMSQDLPIELVRRSSFGFLSPSIAETAPSFRIELGITPTEYLEVVIQTLRKLNEVLELFAKDTNRNDIMQWASLPASHFTKVNDKYRTYMSEKVPNVNHYWDLCFAKIDKKGGSTLKNALRSYEARRCVSTYIFNESKIGANLRAEVDIFWGALRGALSTVVFDGKQITCNLPNGKYKSSPTKQRVIRCIRFWTMISLIRDRYEEEFKHRNKSKILTGTMDRTITTITAYINTHYIDKLYYCLEKANSLVFAKVVADYRYEHVVDYYGSDSETEGDIQGIRVYGKKVIVKNGTRAILASLETSGQKGQIYLNNMYYEIYETRANIPYATFVKDPKIATHLLTDLTPCVTDTRTHKKTTLTNNLIILILDSTSATQAECREWLKQFSNSKIQTIIFVSSGFKNEQLASDLNPYGTVRIFSRDQALLETLYNKIKKLETPIRSGISHRHRRTMKGLGATPRNRDILFENAPPEEEREDFVVKELTGVFKNMTVLK